MTNIVTKRRAWLPQLNRRHPVIALLGLIVAAVFPVVGQAQLNPSAPPPSFNNTDANGVDLTTGQFRFSMVEASIGDGPGAVALSRYWGDGIWRDNWGTALYGQTVNGVTTYYVDFGGTSDSFSYNGSTFVSLKGNGATLTQTYPNYTYTAPDGTQIVYNTVAGARVLSGAPCTPQAAVCALPNSITRPDGVTYGIYFDTAEKCIGPINPDCATRIYYRFSSVSGNAGYGFAISYQSNDPGTGSTPPPSWSTRNGITFGNSKVACGTICPTILYSTSAPLTITDALGRVWRFTISAGRITSLKRPGSASADTTTISYDVNGRVSSIVRDGVTTNYAFSQSGATATMTVTGADGARTVFTSDMSLGRITSITDPFSRTTTQTYDASARPVETTFPEGNKRVLSYDGRGNVVTATAKAKPGALVADIVSNATYPPSCTTPASCNKPTTTVDAKGNATDLAYDPTTGLMTSVTMPLAAAGGVRPQTRLTYSSVGGIFVPTTVSTCHTTASCANGADEVTTTIAYNANVLPTTASSGSGDGRLTATTAFTYDAIGNRTSVDGPLPGTADTTRTLYDAARQVVGVISPDPDGAGPLLNRATRLTYNPDGQVTLAEQGTTAGQTDANWSAFSPLQSVASTYDANARKVTDQTQSGGTVYGLTQYSYDALGRPECTATRMNAAAFGSLPASACTLGTAGSFGNDQIAKTVYDAAGQVTKTQLAVGTADAADEVTQT